MRKILWAVLSAEVLFVVCVQKIFGNLYRSGKEDEGSLDLYVRSAVLLDADPGPVLFSKNGREELPMGTRGKS